MLPRIWVAMVQVKGRGTGYVDTVNIATMGVISDKIIISLLFLVCYNTLSAEGLTFFLKIVNVLEIALKNGRLEKIKEDFLGND